MKTAIAILLCFVAIPVYSQVDSTLKTGDIFTSYSGPIGVQGVADATSYPQKPLYPGGDSALVANFKARIQTPAIFKECDMGASVRITYYIEPATGKFTFPQCNITYYDKYSYRKSIYIPRCQDSQKDIEAVVKQALDAMPPYPVYATSTKASPVTYTGQLIYEFPIQ